MTTSARHAQVKQIFLAVIDAPADQRGQVLRDRCGDDLELRAEVETLLRHHLDETVGRQPAARPEDSVDSGTGGADPSAPLPKHNRAFSSGTMVADRYRIVARIGRGGMGEVYRADDLKLRQTVALKFLPAVVASNPAWRARLVQEVRMARRVTHPNVCRVYDIGEADGDPFISMEYVQGENLASLLKRIGRVAGPRAVQIAWQMSVGLAAAHARGILHRDLKPANIMLDEEGNVRITDFGLAGTVDEARELRPRAGTPAYMSPEQLAGEGAAVQSDLFALGLVLYELFTGRAAFKAESADEYPHLHESIRPEPPSACVPELDIAIEEIILRCLRKDAADRPASAIEVAAALRGGDVLAAALAAGITPSPDTVAEAQIPPQRIGWHASKWLAVAACALLATYVCVAPKRSPLARSRDAKPPAVLAEMARQQIRDAIGTGIAAPGVDYAYGFTSSRSAPEILAAVGAPAAGVDRFRTASEVDVVFWYRQRNEPLMPVTARSVVFESARVTPVDPPYGRPGDALVILSAEGEPLLVCVPPPDEGRDALAGASPAVSSLRITQQALQVKPETPTSVLGSPHFRERLLQAAFRTCMVVLVLASVPWAWVNFRAGRGDLQGAARLAVFVFVVRLVVWCLNATLAPVFPNIANHLIIAAMRALGEAAMLYVFYLALEPFVRRHWPQTIVAWSRVLRLRFLDPTVGEHVLLGVALGCLWAVGTVVEPFLPGPLGLSERPTMLQDRSLGLLLGGRFALAALLDLLQFALYRGLAFTLLVVLVRRCVSRTGPAILIAALIVIPMTVPRGAHPATSMLIIGGLGSLLGVWVITRYGLVTVSVGLLTSSALLNFPATTHFRAWYADMAAVPIVLCTVLVVGGLVAARPRSGAPWRSRPTAIA